MLQEFPLFVSKQWLMLVRNSEKRHILYHLCCFQHVCYKLLSSPALFLGHGPKIIWDTWALVHSQAPFWYEAATVPTKTKPGHGLFRRYLPVGNLENSDPSPAAVALCSPPAGCPGCCASLQSCPLPCQMSTHHVDMLWVHSLKPLPFPEVAQALHCLAHFRLEKKKQTHRNKENRVLRWQHQSLKLTEDPLPSFL